MPRAGRYGLFVVPLCLGLLIVGLVLAWGNFDWLYSGILREAAPVVPDYPGRAQVTVEAQRDGDTTLRVLTFVTGDEAERVLTFYGTAIGPPARWVGASGANPRTWEYDPDYCPWTTLTVAATPAASGLTQVIIKQWAHSCRP